MRPSSRTASTNEPPTTRRLPARIYRRDTVRGTLPIALVQVLAHHLSTRGVEPASILTLSLSGTSCGAAVTGRCDAEDFCRWLIEAAEVLRDPLLGLKLGQSVDLAHLGPLGYALLNSVNLGSALNSLLRYHRLLFDLNPVELEVADGLLTLSWPATHGKPGPLFNEAGLAGIVQCIRIMSGQALAPSRVDFSDPRPSDIRPYRAYFGCPVHFDQSLTRLVFPVSHLNLSLKQPDPILRTFMEEQADAALDRLDDTEQGAELRCRVEEAIAHLTTSGMPELTHVASRLRMSPRVLHKKLLDRGLHFRELREMTLQQLAQKHLSQPELSVAEVALLLGYSEQSAFTRAFKRWVGMTPLAWRRKL